jgi:hypothetical protein
MSYPSRTRGTVVSFAQNFLTPPPKLLQEYDDAWAAPTLVYRAAGVKDGDLFAWLIVPQGARGPCVDEAEVLGRAGNIVTVRCVVGGVAHTVSVPIAE